MLLQIAGVSSFIRLNNIPLFYIALPSTRPGFDTWVRKIPWRKKLQPTSVFLPGESHGQRSLEGYSPWGRKELDLIERLTLSFTFMPFIFASSQTESETPASPLLTHLASQWQRWGESQVLLPRTAEFLSEPQFPPL